MTEEGIVIEVVPPDMPVRSARVAFIRRPLWWEPRYVVQTWWLRVLRGADRMVVVLP
jgi:hypothetical protein